MMMHDKTGNRFEQNIVKKGLASGKTVQDETGCLSIRYLFEMSR